MKNLLAGIVLGAILVWVGNSSFEDEIAQEKLYCEMNSGGLWYDSPERYAKICSPESGAETDTYQVEIQKMPRSQNAGILTF